MYLTNRLHFIFRRVLSISPLWIKTTYKHMYSVQIPLSILFKKPSSSFWHNSHSFNAHTHTYNNANSINNGKVFKRISFYSIPELNSNHLEKCISIFLLRKTEWKKSGIDNEETKTNPSGKGKKRKLQNIKLPLWSIDFQTTAHII